MSQTSQFSAGPSNLSMPEATVIPVLSYPDVSVAAAWLCHVFGFSERLRIGNHRIQLVQRCRSGGSCVDVFAVGSQHQPRDWGAKA